MTSSRAVACAGASLLVAGLIGSSVASASPAVTASRLSPRLALLAGQPTVTATEAAALAMADRGPGSLIESPSGAVLVYVAVAGDSSATAEAVRAAGGTVVNVAERVVTASIAPTRTPDLAADPSVRYVRPVPEPYVASAGVGGAVRAVGQVCDTIRSEGDESTRADDARSAFGVDGTGVTVGVVSDTYDKSTADATSAAGDISTGDIPGTGNPCGFTTPVTVLDDSAAGVDEGRAMMQIVHDLAPGARLAFATGFTGEFQMAANIRNLASTGDNGGGAGIVVDDVYYFDEPAFQQGVISDAIADVTAQGVTYVTAAGNHNIIKDVATGLGQTVSANVSSWEAPAYRPVAWASCGFSLIPAPTDCLDFDPTRGRSTGRSFVLADRGMVTITLKWAEPLYGVSTDLDLALVSTGDPSSPGAPVVRAVSRDDNVASFSPAEFVQYTNRTGAAESLRVVVVRNSGSTGTPRVAVSFIQPTTRRAVSDVAFPISANGDIVGPTIFGHSGSPQAITVAAQSYLATTPEEFSSRGPMTTYFEPLPSIVATSPTVVSKPDITATDGGATTFFTPMNTAPQTYRFSGTSAAAPHVAAVVALLQDKLRRARQPGMAPADVKSLLKARATPIANAPANSSGAGYVDALMTLATPPTRPRAPTGTAGNASVQLRWAAGGAGGLPVDGYEVTPTPTGPACASATTTVTCAGLTNGRAYTFTVRQHTALGWSPQSLPSAPITPRTVPSAPVAATGTAGNRSVTLRWSAPSSTGGSPVTGYVASANPPVSGVTRSCASTSTTTCTVSGLVNGVTYNLRVRARNAAGLGPQSEVVTRTPFLTITPTWSRSGRTVRATFAPVAGATRYRLALAGATRGASNCTATATRVSCAATLQAGTTTVEAQALLAGGGISARGRRSFTIA